MCYFGSVNFYNDTLHSLLLSRLHLLLLRTTLIIIYTATVAAFLLWEEHRSTGVEPNPGSQTCCQHFYPVLNHMSGTSRYYTVMFKEIYD